MPSTMELMNLTIGSIYNMWDSLHESVRNFSFSGFSNQEIWEESMWKVLPKSNSTTISVQPAIYDKLVCELFNRYGQPEDKGKKGHIYRALVHNELESESALVSITCYQSTTTLNIQGNYHSIWTESVLKEIGQKLNSTGSQHDIVTDQPHLFDSSLDTTLDQLPSLGVPLTSTPAPSVPKHHLPIRTVETSCHANCSSSAVSMSTQTLVEMKSRAVQMSIIHHSSQIQTEMSGDTELKLRDEIQRLKNTNRDLRAQLTEYRELRGHHAQLTQAHRELCDRNSVLQAKLYSLSESSSFVPAKPVSTTTRTSKPPTEVSLETSNRFQGLHIDEIPDTDEFEPLIPSAPPIEEATPTSPGKVLSSSPPHAQTTSTVEPAPTSSPTPSSNDPQIIVFSNSICKRINSSRFYRGKNTKVYAKGGATIPDVQRLVHDCDDHAQGVECVILQAWTNTTAKLPVTVCERQARALIEATLQKFPNAKVIVSGVLPRFWNDNANTVSAQLNHTFKSNCQASKHVFFVDNPPSFLSGTRLREDLFWDNVHLNRKGLNVLIHNLRNAIDTYVYPQWIRFQGIK